MIKRISVLSLVLALAICASSTSVFAGGSNPSEPGTSPEAKETSSKASTPNAKLKMDVEKLVRDAKAGKVAPRPQQFPQTSRNNLSKTTKIALIATAIGTSIFLIVLFHDLSKD